MNKTFTTSNQNGTYISFLEYEYEEDFESFLTFLSSKLNFEASPVSRGPYSLLVEIVVDGSALTASYNTDADCYLYIPAGVKLTSDEIIKRCFGEAGA